MTAGLKTDEHWELWGRQRPYVGVLVSSEFDDLSRGDPAWQRFMHTGEAQVDELFQRLGQLGAPSSFERALDFGCGVGRIIVPLASRCDEVVGVDVSAAMRAEATANVAHHDITNVTVVPSDDQLSQVEGTFDLVHSYNVLQHISPRRGLAITNRLLDRTRPGGVVVLHYCDYAPAFRHRAKRVIGRSSLSMRLANKMRGKAPDTPVMQMMPYRFDAVADLLRSRGVRESLVVWGDYGRNTFFQVHAVLPR